VVGDNLVALREWGSRFAGQAALVLADPPYNARNRKDYDDDVGHDDWLESLRVRLELCLPLLRPDGILAVHIDDSEHAYLQILLDRLMGRAQRRNTVVVKMSELAGVKMRYRERLLPRVKEYVLLYGAGPEAALNPLRRVKEGPALDAYLKYYVQVLENPEAPVDAWRVTGLREALEARGLEWSREAARSFQLAHAEIMVYRTNNRWFDSLEPQDRPTTTFARLTSPWGVPYVWWEGKQMLRLADHLEEPLSDLWTDISTINVQREGGVPLRSSKKPEHLVLRLLELCSRPGDLVVDPWSGSGTTAAVAHKSGRGWLSCEREPKIAERAISRMKSVIEGNEPSGVTSSCRFGGGGGFVLRVL
jgi:adenine-specific DNA-methyltransferase